MTKILGIGTLAAILVGFIFFFVMKISYQNTEVSLKNQFEAQKSDVENVYDNMWKILQQQAGVTSEYKDTFKEVYPKLIEGRYGNEKGGSLMKFIQESNPNFDTGLYQTLMQSIEAQRGVFVRKQRQVIDVKRQYNTFVQQPVAAWFLNNPKPLEYTVISSTKSKQVMETGVDDDVDLFKKK